MTLEAWALFCLVELALAANPGPSALVVVSQSLTRGGWAGIRAATGVLAANAIYFALAASGMLALHRVSAEVFGVLQWGGAAYLLWLGGRMIWRAGNAPPAGDGKATRRGGRPFWRGFVSQGANPNLLLYFTAVLPQFVEPTAPLAPQVAILAASSFAIELSVLSAYSSVSDRIGERGAPRWRAGLERLGGGLLLTAGAGLARIERE